MSKSNQNIDETFRNAFQDWEADYSVSEMNADWDAFSKKLPQQPQAPKQPSGKSPLANNPAGMGAAKILGLSTVAGIIITAASILLYNSNENKTAEKILTEAIEVPVTEKSAEESTTATSNAGIAELNTENNKNKSGEVQPGAGNVAADIQRNPVSAKSQLYSSPNVKQNNTASIHNNNSNINNNTNGNSVTQPISAKQNDNNNNTAAVNVKQRRTVELADTSVCISQPVIINDPENNSEMRIEWGDGKKLSVMQDAPILYKYEKPGIYNIRIERRNETIVRKINVKAAPVAHFNNTQSNGLTCKFKNFSEGANAYMWYFGDNSYPVPGFNAEHTYRDTGRFMVKLIAFNSAGCTDTLIQQVYVSNRHNFNIPNVITPNGDGSNDVFDARINDAVLYELLIMDFSGQVVFQTNDKNAKWDGINQQNGKPCISGNYVYSLRYRFEGENINLKSGFITLIR